MWALITGLLSLSLCWGFIKIAPKDAPDTARKTQTAPVPTSGGVAIAAAIALSLAGFVWIDGNQIQPAIGARFYIYLSLFVLILGALDDAKDLPAKPKLFALLLATSLAAGFGHSVDRVFLPVADSIFLLPLWLGIAGTAFWVFIMMNASNFMDGSNGLSLGTLAILIASFGFVPEPVAPSLLAVTVMAVLGFLFWNLQGKLYAGDAGSLFGGAVFASLGVYAARDGNIWMPATLALPFLVDVFLTLAWRAMRGRNLLQAHRDHAYQGLIKSGWGHIKTALLWWTFALICSASAVWAAGDSKSMSAFVFFALLGAGCSLWIVHRWRLPETIKQAS